MVTQLLILAACAVVTVVAVRFLVMRGIDAVCEVLGLSSKAKGQILGYATSLPELVVVSSSAYMGVFDAGFWNIASSNIINWCLFLSALLIYRQHRDLWQVKFIDELGFGVLSVVIPLVMLWLAVETTPMVAGGLIAFFIVYKVVDRRVNPAPEKGETRAGEEEPASGVGLGVGLLVVGLLLVVGAGRFLGGAAQALIEDPALAIPAWAVGWILGFITSIPELTGFFEIYRVHKKRGTLDLDDDTQESLDALVASNLCNLGVILPVGVLIFAAVT
ncbi:MAG: hypothetical protein ACYTGH_13520 [Planctomycetota bacterium]|jgi:hypothetical protein